MARDTITDLWGSAPKAPRDLEVQQRKKDTLAAVKAAFENENSTSEQEKSPLNEEERKVTKIDPTAEIDPTAQIHPSVKIPERCTIGANVVIKKGVKLSPGVSL